MAPALPPSPSEGKQPFDLDNAPPNVTFWNDTHFPECQIVTCPDCDHYAEKRQARVGADKLYVDHVWVGGIWAGSKALRCDYCMRLLRHY